MTTRQIIADPQLVVNMLDTISGILQPVYESQVLLCRERNVYKAYRDLYISNTPPANFRFTRLVEESFLLHSYVQLPENKGRRFDIKLDNEFSFSINILVLTTRIGTFLLLQNIQLPIKFRNKGIFTDIVGIIKRFMDDNYLGNVIGLSDSNEYGLTSRVINKHELYGDPFMLFRYNLGEFAVYNRED